MSIDLDWSKLDGSLATFLVDVLNKQLGAVERPSFIGPVEVTSLDFGSAAPDVELVDMRDIFRDFLEDEDDDESDDPVKVTEGADDEEGFEWVSRRAAGREESLAFQQRPPHLQFGHGGHRDLYASMPSLRSPIPISSSPSTNTVDGLWRSTPSLGRLPSMGSPAHPTPVYHRSPTPSTPFAPGPLRQNSSEGYGGDDFLAQAHPAEIAASRIPMGGPESLSNPSSALESPDYPPQQGRTQEPPVPANAPPANPHPNLQLHLYLNWHSNLRITLTTSLLINYPSPMFMSLPIKLSVTGLVFTGEVAVAYEGERRRVHLCVLDDQDPYGPAAGKRADTSFGSMDDLAAAMGAAATGAATATPTTATGLNTAGSADQGPSTPITPSPPSDLDPDADNPHHHPLHPLHHPLTHHALHQPRTPQKPHLPIGQRLLPSIYIESEIGQADKHVLKNVTRVERFIQDVIRKTVEEELVFPNFHTLILSEQSPSTGT